jgi:hypothetical protein
MGVAYVRFAVPNPSHYRVMFGGFVDPDGREPELVAEAQGAFQVLRGRPGYACSATQSFTVTTLC